MYVEDVFVKNILPVGGKKVEITITVNNATSQTLDAVFPVTITSAKTSIKLASQMKWVYVFMKNRAGLMMLNLNLVLHTPSRKSGARLSGTANILVC